MKLYNLFFLLFCANVSFAQNTTAKIEKVKADGLHKIVLPTNVRSASNDDLSDFRILDSKGNEVPYFVNKNLEPISDANYKEYKIISRSEIPKKQSTLIFENSDKTINQVALTIANYEGEKTFTISGSNDQKEWFGISNNNYLSDLNASDATSVSKTINFPLTNYNYIKINLDDKKSLPIRIISIGNFNFKTIATSFLPVNYNKKTITELKSDKKTLLHFEFEKAINIENIKFQISNPKLFKRYAKIYRNETRKVKHKTENYHAFMANFELSSDSKNTFTLAGIKEKDFYIEIENQDNQPLTIDNIQFFQYPVSIIADLKANENYTIKTGNSNATLPVYDIENFKNNIPNNLPTATISEIKFAEKAVENNSPKSFWQQPWFMWVCISLGAIAILYFASSLVKDLNKK
ncbi:hypothetical protein [Flavobacterium sp.]|uniref:hypothetical protein n=1 Tax=Flavobacterium sp. TaxID=239 RepID=UPI0037529AD3